MSNVKCAIRDARKIPVTKWQIIAEYTRQEALGRGANPDEAKINAIAVAISGYQRRIKGVAPYPPAGGVAVSKKEYRLKPSDFDSDVIDKMDMTGMKCYEAIFAPAIKRLRAKGLDYDGIKSEIGMPTGIGASVSLDKFVPFSR